MSTNILSLDRAIQTTILWLNDIQEELNWDSRDNVYKATKAVLQSIRDRLSFEEVVHFSSNLPLVMKGMMMDGYDIRDKPLNIRSLDEFFETVQQNYDGQRRDIVNAGEASRAVMKVLKNKMGGEVIKAGASMPGAIKKLFESPDEAVVDVPEGLEIPQHE